MEVVFQIIEFKQPKSVGAQGFVYLFPFEYLYIYLFICAGKLIGLIMSEEMSLTRTLTRADWHSFVHINCEIVLLNRREWRVHGELHL